MNDNTAASTPYDGGCDGTDQADPAGDAAARSGRDDAESGEAGPVGASGGASGGLHGGEVQAADASRVASAASPRSAARIRYRFGVELPGGRGITFTVGKFRWNRWIGDTGYGTVSDGGPSKRWRCYQWPFGLINVYGRWGDVR